MKHLQPYEGLNCYFTKLRVYFCAKKKNETTLFNNSSLTRAILECIAYVNNV